MSTGPLRRATGCLGLLALVPIVVQLVTGAIGPEQAATRALAVAVVVIGVGHLVTTVVRTTLRRVEARQDGEAPPADPARVVTGRTAPAPTEVGSATS